MLKMATAWIYLNSTICYCLAQFCESYCLATQRLLFYCHLVGYFKDDCLKFFELPARYLMVSPLFLGAKEMYQLVSGYSSLHLNERLTSRFMITSSKLKQFNYIHDYIYSQD